jgi:hypothetical protein
MGSSNKDDAFLLDKKFNPPDSRYSGISLFFLLEFEGLSNEFMGNSNKDDAFLLNKRRLADYHRSINVF